MKILGVLWLMMASLFGSFSLLHAQALDQTNAPDSIVQVTAEAEGLTQIAPEDLPLFGTFWEVMPSGIMAPLPCPPVDLTMPIYGITDSVFLVDATGGTVSLNPHVSVTSSNLAAAVEAQGNAIADLIEQTQETEYEHAMMRSFGMDVPTPSDGDGGGDGGGDTNSYFSSFVIDTNQLWLEITNVSGNTVFANLHNGTNQVYAIWGTTNLPASWKVESEVWPTDTNCMPFTVQTQNRQNLLLRAQDWTGVTHGGNTTPDWWLWLYFGTTAMSDTNLDLYGQTLVHDFTNNIIPNIFSFSGVKVVDSYVSSSSVSAQLSMIGRPYYIATLVDDTNFANAVWNIYTSSNVTVNLGATEGWHEVRIGLRGHADDADAAIWQWNRLKLDFTAPSMVITGPTNSTVAVSLTQLTGYSPEALASISYNISNAMGTAVNQQALIIGQSYSTNTMEFTTNYFQCYDVVLANGVNAITLHAVDLAGNVTTLTNNIIYTPDTNPPVMALVWPQDRMKISGGNFTIQGVVNDPAATVSVAIMNASGSTNRFNGLTGRDGNFWIENVSLSAGTNSLSLAVSNGIGGTITNFTVVKITNALSINAVLAGQTDVSGSIGTNGYTIWANGIQATQTNGTWSAQITPICVGGGTVNVTAIPNSDNGGNGSGGSVSGMAANPSSTESLNSQTTVASPQNVFISAYHLNDHEHALYRRSYAQYGGYAPGTTSQNDKITDWTDKQGGGGSTYLIHYMYDGYYSFSSWQPTGWPEKPYGTTTIYSIFFPQPAGSGPDTPKLSQEHCNINQITQYIYGEPYWYVERKVDTEVQIATGGPLGSTAKHLWQFTAYVTDVTTEQPVPNEQIALGNFGNLDTAGYVYAMLPDNDPDDITPRVKGNNYYRFLSPIGSQITLQSLTVVSNSAVAIGSNNWATVKTPTNGWVYVQATLSTSDTNAASQIVWSTGEKVPGNPFAVRVPKTNSVETTVTATLGSTNKSLNVWIVWGTVQILTSGTNPPPPFPQYPSSVDNGAPILGPRTNSTGDAAWGKITAVAQISPAGIHNIITNGWVFKREKMRRDFIDGVRWDADGISPPADGWLDDSSFSDYQSQIPDANDKIYDIDGPNIGYFQAGAQCIELNKNFHQWIEWNGSMASDGTTNTSNFPSGAEWHWNAKWQINANPRVIYTSLGGGNTSLPNTSAGCP